MTEPQKDNQKVQGQKSKTIQEAETALTSFKKNYVGQGQVKGHYKDIWFQDNFLKNFFHSQGGAI